MAEIVRIDDWYGEGNLFVPGTDPAQILRDAADALEDHEVVLTEVNEVKVEWFRVNPCNEHNCYEGGNHRGHWTPTGRQTRGGFQGALLVVGDKDDEVQP